MLEVTHERVVLIARDLLRVARYSAYEVHDVLVQEQRDLTVVVILMSYSVETVDVVPDGMTERSRIHVIVVAHAVSYSEKS